MVTTVGLPRVGTARNPTRPTLGPYIDETARTMGFEPHAWQTLLSDVSLELSTRPDGRLRLHGQYVGALVGRQSGKTAWCAARVVAQCLLPERPDIAAIVGNDRIGPQHVAYTAQSRTVAVSRWLEHVDIIERTIGRERAKVRYATGREVMEFVNGSTYRPVTPNRTGARGLSLDLVIVDEALAHPLWLLAVLRPTQSQRDNAPDGIGAQFVVVSNAGDDDSELLNRMQDLGHESMTDPDSRRVWMEWSADPEADPLAETTWLTTMPTLEQPNGIALEFVRTEAQTLPLDQFMREYLCVRLARSQQQIIPSELWHDLYRSDVVIPPDLAIAIDVTPDRGRASIVAAGQVDHYLPIEIIQAQEGLEWCIRRVTEICQRWSAPVAIDIAGPAATMIPALEAAGVTVLPLAARDVADAAAMFYDATLQRRICHLNDHRMNDAVTGASKRAVGQRWAFDRRGNVDISPLVAASFAIWAIETNRAETPTIW